MRRRFPPAATPAPMQHGSCGVCAIRVPSVPPGAMRVVARPSNNASPKVRDDGRAVTLCKAARCHAGSIKLSSIGGCAKRLENSDFWVGIRLSPTIDRTNVLKWEIAVLGVIKLHAITMLSVYFSEENNFVAFPTLSHCSENEKPLTPANLPLYSGAWW